jgi:hypothetical protein
MTDLAVTLLFAIAAVFLVVELTAGVAAEHTDTQLPRAVMYGQRRQNLGRRALLVEIPLFVIVVAVAVLVLVMMLIHPQSTWVVRLVAAAALVAIVAWCIFLTRRVSRAHMTPSGPQRDHRTRGN